MSMKCEKPLDELTVQVWFLYDRPNGEDGRTIWLLDAPTDLSGQGHKNKVYALIILPTLFSAPTLSFFSCTSNQFNTIW